jgi:hypothetical protein
MINTCLYTFIKTHKIIFFKRVNFIVHKLYLNKMKRRENERKEGDKHDLGLVINKLRTQDEVQLIQ